MAKKNGKVNDELKSRSQRVKVEGLKSKGPNELKSGSQRWDRRLEVNPDNGGLIVNAMSVVLSRK